MGPAAFHLMKEAGAGPPLRVALQEGRPLVVGRAEGCGFRLEESRASREHLRLTLAAGEVVLEDLGSSAGTRVNGTRVERAALVPGDRIEIGKTVLRLEGPGPAPAPAGTEEDASLGLLDALTSLLAGDEADTPRLLERMLEGLVGFFRAERALVFLPGEDGKPEVACQVGPRPAPPGPEEPISRQLVAKAAAAASPLLLTSLETMELRQEFRSIPGTLRSILAAPLATPRGPGVLYLDSALERRRFEDRERRVLAAFATAAGSLLTREHERREAKSRGERLSELLRRSGGRDEILGDSPAAKAALAELARAAASEVTVLITGESGTGKELAARALHRRGARAQGPFVAVNCAAIPPELVESELFGHEKGAFTGATERRLGQFELAQGGTLFLDEIGELPLPVQGKLLRALQERTLVRVGSTKPVAVDFRLVSATHVDLAAAVAAGRFRQDLFYRIAVFRMRLPALRERGEDVLLLARSFLARFARQAGRTLEGFEPAAERALVAHGWPGNVRELSNAVEQAVVREEGPRVGLASLAGVLGPAAAGPAGPGGDPGPAVAAPAEDDGLGIEAARKAWEKRYLLRQLARHKGNMTATAEAIGLGRRNLYVKCEEYGIDPGAFR